MTCVCILGRGTQRLNRKWFWRTRNYCLWPCSLAVPVLAGWVYAFLWFFVQELLEAQPAVVLVLKRLRRRGKWLEVSSDRLGELGICFCGRVPWLYQYWPGWFMLFVVLCPGTPKGSTGSGSGFKASQKNGQWLKVSSDRLGEAGNRTWN